MNTRLLQVWYLRNGDIEQVVACDQPTAMQLLGAMSGHVGELLPEMDPDGELREMACQNPGKVFTKRYDQPFAAWSSCIA